jgi:Oxidoreductase molybdopterin binding domain
MSYLTSRRALAAIGAALLATFAVTATTAGARATRRHTVKPPACAVFHVGGHVANPLRLHVDDLRSYPVHTADVTFQSGSGTQSHHYVGALLTDVLATAQPTYNPAVKNDLLRFYAQAIGSDDYAAIVAFGEIDPGFGAKQVLLAYQEDSTDLCSAGPRLVVPGDIKGGRYVSNVVTIRVGRAGG